MNKASRDKKKEQDVGNEFYLVEEVAKKLRVSNMTIYRYIKAKKFLAHKIGKEFRIRKEELENYLEKVSTK